MTADQPQEGIASDRRFWGILERMPVPDVVEVRSDDGSKARLHLLPTSLPIKSWVVKVPRC